MSGCICEGNWRDIIKETETLIGKWFKDENGCSWRLQGILWAEDDFYYLFADAYGYCQYISCCVVIEKSGMTLD